MATAQNPASLGTTSTTRTAQPAGSLRFDWLYTVLGTWLIGGVFLDGWAHTHGKVDKSFFTPWHAILFGVSGRCHLSGRHAGAQPRKRARLA